MRLGWERSAQRPTRALHLSFLFFLRLFTTSMSTVSRRAELERPGAAVDCRHEKPLPRHFRLLHRVLLIAQVVCYRRSPGSTLYVPGLDRAGTTILISMASTKTVRPKLDQASPAHRRADRQPTPCQRIAGEQSARTSGRLNCSSLLTVALAKAAPKSLCLLDTPLTPDKVTKVAGIGHAASAGRRIRHCDVVSGMKTHDAVNHLRHVAAVTATAGRVSTVPAVDQRRRN